jgi:hypothetical protein
MSSTSGVYLAKAWFKLVTVWAESAMEIAVKPTPDAVLEEAAAKHSVRHSELAKRFFT